MKTPIYSLLFLVLIFPAGGYAQDTPSERIYPMEPIVVTAPKVPLPLPDISTTARVLTREELAHTPGTTLAGVLAGTEGLHIYDFSGSGTNPTVEIRGFASAGETSYLLLLIDGIPANELDSDGVDWNMLDVQQIERIEVLRGPTSTLYGNIGMSGLVNVVTRRAEEGIHSAVTIGGGSHGDQTVTASGAYGDDTMQLDLSVRRRNVEGWRDHSTWSGTQVHSTLKWRPLGTRTNALRQPAVTLQALYRDTEREEPGPIALGMARTASSTPLDRNDARKWQLGLLLDLPVRSKAHLEVIGTARGKNADVLETIFYQPKDHDIESRTYSVETRVRGDLGIGDRRIHLLAGIEGEHGDLQSAYYDVDPAGDRAQLASDGETTRSTLGAYARAEITLLPRLSLSGGIRYDDIRGEYRSAAHPEDEETTMSALSPSMALNWRWETAGNLYASVNRSFKAPTLEQLYDKRPFFVSPDFPPITLSNSALEPQHAWNYEIGLRTHYTDRIWMDLALYYLHIRDEIGFDLQHFQYANIDESIHQGGEWRLSTRLTDDLEHRFGYTLMKATFEGGEHGGNQINGVPKHLASTGLAYTGTRGESASVDVQHVRDQYIDEGNRHPLEDYTLVNARLGYRFDRFLVDITIQNLFDSEYEATGYLTQGQDEEGNLFSLPQYYPGATRSMTARIAATF